MLLATMGGGLGCFLLGMKHLSEGLQSVGGAGLKRFMSAMTTNRIAGMMTGVVSTSSTPSTAHGPASSTSPRPLPAASARHPTDGVIRRLRFEGTAPVQCGGMRKIGIIRIVLCD